MTQPQISTSFSRHYWDLDYEHANEVVVFSTGALGDPLMLSALLCDLKHQYPHLKIHLARNQGVEWIFRHNPFIDGFFQEHDPPGATASGTIVIDYRALFQQLPEYFNGIGFMDILGNVAGIPFAQRRPVYTAEPEELMWAKRLLDGAGGSGPACRFAKSAPERLAHFLA